MVAAPTGRPTTASLSTAMGSPSGHEDLTQRSPRSPIPPDRTMTWGFSGVGREGLEPPTPCASCRCASQLRQRPRRKRRYQRRAPGPPVARSGLLDDHVGDDLVVPALVLVVPEHPEVAKEAEELRQDASEVPADRPTGADLRARVDIDDPQVHRPLAHRLA